MATTSTNAIVKIPKGTRAALDAKAVAGTIVVGQQYLITDEDRTAVGLTINSYSALAKQSEAGGSSVFTPYLHTPGTAIQTGIIIPLYVYPASIYTNTAINNLLQLIRKYQTVPVVVVVNPSNGPGTVVDGNYAACINRLQGAGATVVGYVSTAYTAVSQATVQADILTWKSLYPNINGIFLDEQSNVGGNESYYTSLTNYCHNQSLFPVVGNPGAGLPESYFIAKTSDIWLTYESAGYPSEASMFGDYGGGYADYSYHKRGAIVHTVSFSAEQLNLMRKYMGWVYITPDVMPNPYDTISSALENTFRYLSLCSESNPNIVQSKTGTVVFDFTASGNVEAFVTILDTTTTDSPNVICMLNPKGTVLNDSDEHEVLTPIFKIVNVVVGVSYDIKMTDDDDGVLFNTWSVNYIKNN